MMTTFASALGRGTVRPSASNTSDNAVAIPTVSGVFSRLITLVFGRDGRHGNVRRTALSVLLTSRPPVARSKATSGYQSHNGDTTMPQGNPTTTGAPAQTPPNEASNQATLPRYQQQGTPHPERIQIAPSPSKSLNAETRQLLIHTALYKAGSLLLAGSFSQSLGQALIASRHMKQLCADSQVGGANHE